MSLEREFQLQQEVRELRQQLAAAQAEINEQARIIGMGGEREIDLRQKLDIVSALLREASGRMSHGHWSSEFRARVETALKTKEPITNRRRNADDLSPYILFDATREN